MENFNEQLGEILKKRIESLNRMYEEIEKQRDLSEKIEIRKLDIKLTLEENIKEAEIEIVKTKYSNADKRRLELDKLMINDTSLTSLKWDLGDAEKNIRIYETADKIIKLQERYLFKTIDIYISENEINSLKAVKNI